MQANRQRDDAIQAMVPAGGILPGLGGSTFDLLLKLGQHRAPGADAVCAFVGGRLHRLSWGQLSEHVSRMAGLLSQMGALPGQRLLIAAPMGADASITLLAGLRLGLVPYLVADCVDQAALGNLLESTGAELAVGVDHIGEFKPLELLRAAAARTFGLRCIAGFGAAIPDGVVPLDHHLASDACPKVETPAGKALRQFGVVQIGQHVAGLANLSEASVLEAGLKVVQALEIAPDSRILTTQLGADLPALATGLAAALLSGAEYMPSGLFSLAGLEAGLQGDRKTHLVAPASTASALLKAGLAHHPAVATLVFIHAQTKTVHAHALPVPAEIPVVDIFCPSGSEIEILVRRPA